MHYNNKATRLQESVIMFKKLLTKVKLQAVKKILPGTNRATQKIYIFLLST